MCRWIAYSGPPIFLEDALFRPENSLIKQSRSALHSHVVTNGDGFGIGRYAGRAEPGLFRDVLPAWNDDNLRSVSEQISSHLFFAHVRASTGTATTRANCHPFRQGRWLFMHNGAIGGFERIRREIDLAIPPEHYGKRIGTTDSEAFFLLLMANGLERDAPAAFARTIGEITAIMRKADIAEPFRMTAAATDGEQVIVIRYSSDAHSPSLFTGQPTLHPNGAEIGKNAIVIMSEPFDSETGKWTEIPEAHMLIAGDGAMVLTPFAPAS